MHIHPEVLNKIISFFNRKITDPEIEYIAVSIKFNNNSKDDLRIIIAPSIFGTNKKNFIIVCNKPNIKIELTKYDIKLEKFYKEFYKDIKNVDIKDNKIKKVVYQLKKSDGQIIADYTLMGSAILDTLYPETFTEQYYLRSKDDECSICHVNLSENPPVCVTNCNHFFHCNCINTWLKEKNTCPLCGEEDVKLKQISDNSMIFAFGKIKRDLDYLKLL